MIILKVFDIYATLLFRRTDDAVSLLANINSLFTGCYIKILHHLVLFIHLLLLSTGLVTLE